MNEMIERVAKVAQRWQGHPGVPASAYEPLARLMIEAMRKPTDAMLTSAGDDYWDAEIHWQRMIDAALAPVTNGDGK